MSRLFEIAIDKPDITVASIQKLHEQSNIAGVTELITGKIATAERIGCVISPFIQLQQNLVDLNAAQDLLADC